MSLNDLHRITAQQPGEAEALPFETYRDPEHFEIERRQIFAADWVFVCMEADLPDPGDYHALKIADEHVVVVRGSDGELRALSNVCRHRGAVMLQGSGNTSKIVCPYHAWTYGQAGALQGVPHRGEVAVDRATHCLPRFRLGTFFGLVFVSLDDDAPALDERFRGLEKYFARYGVERFEHRYPIDVQPWQANWKLPMENFVEGYHFFAVHPRTVETAASTRDCFYVEGHADWSITGGSQLDDPDTWKDWIRGRSREVHYLSICLPPNFVCNLYDGYMNWARVLPTGPTTCEIATGSCSLHAFQASQEYIAIAEQTTAEDREICEMVQQGISSRRSKGGRLVELERAVVDFHQYLGKRLFGEDHSRRFRTEHADHFDGTCSAAASESPGPAAASSRVPRAGPTCSA